MSIPKIIHLCWFGKGEYPKLAIRCMDSWRQLLPNYEIKLWNEESFSVDAIPFTKEAYANKKWAFVSDYVRLEVLYRFGGVYMDTDLEVIQDFSPLLEGKKYVSSYIEGGLITAGFIASEPGHPFVKCLLDYYKGRHFVKNDGSFDVAMNPLIFTKIAIDLYGFEMNKHYFENASICIFPLETFMPYRKNILGKNSTALNNYHITEKTFTVHHDMGSWNNPNPLIRVIKGIARLTIPERLYIFIKRKKNAERIHQREKTGKGF